MFPCKKCLYVHCNSVLLQFRLSHRRRLFHDHNDCWPISIKGRSTNFFQFIQADIMGNETCSFKINFVFTWRTTNHMGASRGRIDDSQWESTICSDMEVLLWLTRHTRTLQNNTQAIWIEGWVQYWFTNQQMC